MSININVGNVKKKVKEIYINKDGTKKKIKSVWVNKDGVATKVYSGIPSLLPDDETTTNTAYVYTAFPSSFVVAKLKFTMKGVPNRWEYLFNDNILISLHLIYFKGLWIKSDKFYIPKWSTNIKNETSGTGSVVGSVSMSNGANFGMCSNSDMLLCITKNSSISKPPYKLHKSTDGKNWTLIKEFPNTDMSYISKIAINKGIICIFYKVPNDYDTGVYWSANGTTWTKTLFTRVSGEEPSDDTYINTVAVNTTRGTFITGGFSSRFGGYYHSTYPSQISQDGKTWSIVGGPKCDIYTIISKDDYFYAVAQLEDKSHVILKKYYAYNSWTIESRLDFSGNILSFGYGYFIVVGSDGCSAYSTDAKVWTKMPDITSTKNSPTPRIATGTPLGAITFDL